jgi:beta-glucanase (GH16 family)
MRHDDGSGRQPVGYQGRNLVMRRVAALSTLLLAALCLAGLTSTQASADVSSRACGWKKFYKADGSQWQCVFAENFGGVRLNTSRWRVHEAAKSGAMPGHACWSDDKDNVRVSGGALRLTVRKTSAPFVCHSLYGDFTTQYTGGSISTWDSLTPTYGRFEIRAKMPTAKVAGIHSAIWLFPVSSTYGPWPTSGEIDIAEYYTKYPDRSIPYLHYKSASTSPVTNTQCMIRNPRNYHVYTAEWTRGRIVISYDGVPCLVHQIKPAAPLTGSAPFDQPFYLILSQALGIGQNPFDPATTPLPQTMIVDRVRVWQ